MGDPECVDFTYDKEHEIFIFSGFCMHFAKKKPFLSMYKKSDSKLEILQTKIMKNMNDFIFDQGEDLRLIYIDVENENDYFMVSLDKKILVVSIENQRSFTIKFEVCYPQDCKPKMCVNIFRDYYSV